MQNRTDKNLIVGLDIGTSKVVAIVGEVNDEGIIEVIGIGSHPSRGLKKGVVVNIESTVHSIHRAVEEAELMAGCDIHSVYTGIAGSHVRSLNSHGIVGIRDSEVSSGDVDPQLVLLWAYDVTDALAIAGNVGLASITEDGDRFAQTSASLAAAFAVTSRLGAYVEYFGFYPNAEGSDCAHTLNGGLTYLINNNFQIDLRVGAGLNEEADDFFTGVGFAWRF